ncbi:MAG: hypothetical protein LBQ34_00610 [Alphaproteobacteria bacterium]|jgi:hypothetical protein|nr:hypothetical protein [Alphaproteobacteria bacterium]
MANKKVSLDVFKVVGRVANIHTNINLVDLLTNFLPNTAVRERILRLSTMDETAESDLINWYAIKGNIIEGMLCRIKMENKTPSIQKDTLDKPSFTLQEIDMPATESIEGFIKQSTHFVVKENYIAAHHRNDFNRAAIETYFATILKRPDLKLLPINESQTEVDLSQTKQITISDNLLKTFKKEEEDSMDGSIKLNPQESINSQILTLSKEMKEKLLTILIDNKSLSEELISEYVNFSITMNVKKPADEAETAILESLKISDSSAIKTKLHNGKTLNRGAMVLKSLRDVRMVGDKYLSDSEMYGYLLELIDEAKSK